MKYYLLKITKKEHLGGRVSHLTEGYGWHPDITPWKFYDRSHAEYLRDILKVEDRFACLYTGKVEIEAVDIPEDQCGMAQAVAVIALVLSILVLVFAVN